MATDIAHMREEYMRATLDEAGVAADPCTQFESWFTEALRAQLPMANAMSLATGSRAGRPSLRMVLLKSFDARGFTFFTNYESRKGRELAACPGACLLFHWVELERQVRIEGRVEKTTREESDAYFAQRPPGSRYAAIASPQSEVVTGRADLEARFAQALARYGDHAPRPAQWGGYRVVPDSVEFWQGRSNRLHDRVQYRLAEGEWKIERLAP